MQLSLSHYRHPGTCYGSAGSAAGAQQHQTHSLPAPHHPPHANTLCSLQVSEDMLRLVVEEAQRSVTGIDTGEGRMIKAVLDMQDTEVHSAFCFPYCFSLTSLFLSLTTYQGRGTSTLPDLPLTPNLYPHSSALPHSLPLPSLTLPSLPPSTLTPSLCPLSLPPSTLTPSLSLIPLPSLPTSSLHTTGV